MIRTRQSPQKILRNAASNKIAFHYSYHIANTELLANEYDSDFIVIEALTRNRNKCHNYFPLSKSCAVKNERENIARK